MIDIRGSNIFFMIMNRKVYLAVITEKVNAMCNTCTIQDKPEHNYLVQVLLK